MEKINIRKILASFGGCFAVTAISALHQPQVLPDISPSLEALNNLFSANISQPAALILSGIGLICIASAARGSIRK